MIFFSVIVLGSVLVIPLVIYLSVKMGTIGYLMSKYQFKKNCPTEENENGHS